MEEIVVPQPGDVTIIPSDEWGIELRYLKQIARLLPPGLTFSEPYGYGGNLVKVVAK
jgi:hypothetical protein